jgi:hypothetical protein
LHIQKNSKLKRLALAMCFWQALKRVCNICVNILKENVITLFSANVVDESFFSEVLQGFQLLLACAYMQK